MSKKLLVATDGSEVSERAVVYAREYAALTSAEVIVVYVIDNAPMYYGGVEGAAVAAINPATFYSSDNPQAKEAIEKAKTVLEVQQADFRILVGSPARSIVSVAEEEDCFHIVVGSRGLTGIKRMLLGSVAREVVSLAHCPVTVVR
jgi:nucleotide-binding universal stress UspA family protein